MPPAPHRLLDTVWFLEQAEARNTRTNWLNSPERANWVNDVKNKQAADVLLPSAPVGGAHAA